MLARRAVARTRRRAAIAASRSSSEHELDRRVHVAERDRDEAGRHAAARDVDGVGVGLRASGVDLDAVRDLLLPRPPRRSRSETTGLTIGPRVIAAPEPSSILPRALRVAAGHVGRPGDVDRDRDVAGRARTPPCARRGSRAPPARPRRRRRRPAHRPPRRRAAPPRAPRRRRAGCPSTSRRRARSGARAARPPRRPRRRRARAPRRPRDPSRRCRCAGRRLEPRRARCASRRRDQPPRRRRRARRRSRPAIETRWPAEHAPARTRRAMLNESRPLSSMFVIATPISSMWPTSASVGAPSPGARRGRTRCRACRECTSANADGGVAPDGGRRPSCPDGPREASRQRHRGHKFSQS